ncbi:Transcription initiation factor TFIIIB, partial [Dysosmobacter welbionis]
KDLCLLYRTGLHQPLMVQLGEHGAHAVVPQTSGVVGGGNEVAAQSVHFGQGADLAGVTEVVCEFAAGE